MSSGHMKTWPTRNNQGEKHHRSYEKPGRSIHFLAVTETVLNREPHCSVHIAPRGVHVHGAVQIRPQSSPAPGELLFIMVADLIGPGKTKILKFFLRRVSLIFSVTAHAASAISPQSARTIIFSYINLFIHYPVFISQRRVSFYEFHCVAALARSLLPLTLSFYDA